MRILVSPHLRLGDTNMLGWTLAPNSWNAPQAQAIVPVR
jgi:hypothetical protein